MQRAVNQWKYTYLLLLSMVAVPMFSQTVQVHYDFRHTVDPALNATNFPSLVFEEWKAQSFGAFDFKVQADFSSARNNIGQVYLQLQQSLKLWESGFSVTTQYSGGLGVVDAGQFGYHITNALALGASSTIFYEGVWMSFTLSGNYTAFTRPSWDPMVSVYWGGNVFPDKLTFNGDIELWSQNKNHGDAATAGLKGKMWIGYAEPQLWYHLTQSIAVGSKLNLYYHIDTQADRIQVYPTAAVMYRL